MKDSMPRDSFTVDRRLVLKGAAASVATSALGAPVWAQEPPDALLFTLSDLHAPYARLPAILETITQISAETDAPKALLLNGDIFERGNVVCARSAGEVDWAFLAALRAQMPVIVNLGNHETALIDDLADFICRAEALGITPISNLIDSRTGAPFTPATSRLRLGDIEIALLGLAATNPFVYREVLRNTLSFPEPAQFVAEALMEASAGADVAVVMSHAGLAADKTFIDALPPGSVLHGAHDHLNLHEEHNGVRYFHGGSWGVQLGVLALNKGPDGVRTRYDTQAIAAADGDTALSRLIEAQKAAHLTARDTEIIADITRSLDTHQSILVAIEALRRATQADLAMIGHTTFGAPLTAGPLMRYDFDAFVRFGGAVQVAEVPGDVLATILPRTNQFSATDLAGRTGDFVHVAEVDLDMNRSYRVAVNAWTAINQASYLGTEALPFEKVQGLELKKVIAEHLAAG
ncbi:MAG: metallophosphoesterase [Pseudomonadota bacterium]